MRPSGPAATGNAHRANAAPRWGIALEAKGILGAYYFEDGLDNINNPGNRSQKYKSVHFLDPDYWTE